MRKKLKISDKGEATFENYQDLARHVLAQAILDARHPRKANANYNPGDIYVTKEELLEFCDSDAFELWVSCLDDMPPIEEARESFRRLLKRSKLKSGR